MRQKNQCSPLKIAVKIIGLNSGVASVESSLNPFTTEFLKKVLDMQNYALSTTFSRLEWKQNSTEVLVSQLEWKG